MRVVPLTPNSLHNARRVMSSSKQYTSRPFDLLAAHAWWILLLSALAILWLATSRRIDRINTLTDLPTWSVDAPQRDPDSPTGFEAGQRRLISPGHHSPSLTWIIEAQLAADQGAWRLRHIDYDASPDGRDISRTAPYRWWLTSVGWLYGSVEGEPLGYSIERGALIADPILFALLLIFGATYTARYIGSFAAIGFAIGGICIFPLAANFQPGAPDPHSLAWLLALASILPLLSSPEKTDPRRRLHFIVAGICGGIALWSDAQTQAPFLLATFLGALGFEFLRCRGNDSPTPASHWRAWAIAGATTTLAASLFEFAPDHLAWSLDAVHPLHAVFWWSMGELIMFAGKIARNGFRAFDWRSWTVLALACVALASWPVVGHLTESGSLLASDSYAHQLANHPSGGSENGLGTWLARDGFGPKLALLLPCGIFGFLAFRIVSGKTDSHARARFFLIAIPALIVLALAFVQLRWWNLFDVLALLGLTLLFADTQKLPLPARSKVFASAALFLPGLFIGFPPAANPDPLEELSEMEVRALIARDFSYWLNKRAGSEPNVLFSAPLFSGAATYYGGFDVVISNDGNNQAGFSTAVRLSSSSSAREIPVLIEASRITHIALPLWDPIMDHFARLGRNIPPNQPPPSNAFAVSIKNYSLPSWIIPMNYAVSPEKPFRSFGLKVYAIDSEEETDIVTSRLADLFVERNELHAMRSIREDLLGFPRSVNAKAAIANIDLALGNQAAFEKSIEDLIPYLSRRSARNLPAHRRINLSLLLVQAKRIDLAREQIATCLESLDADTLRNLTPMSVTRLVALSRALEISFPNPDLETFATSLIPPKVRDTL